MKIVQVHNFSVTFRLNKTESFEAVKGIDFSIAKGQILGLIGESGSGKSVTSQAITRLLDDAECSGEVNFLHNDKEINLLTCSDSTLQRIRKEEISYIFQEPMTALNPLIPCGKQILESATLKTSEYL